MVLWTNRATVVLKKFIFHGNQIMEQKKGTIPTRKKQETARPEKRIFLGPHPSRFSIALEDATEEEPWKWNKPVYSNSNFWQRWRLRTGDSGLRLALVVSKQRNEGMRLIKEVRFLHGYFASLVVDAQASNSEEYQTAIQMAILRAVLIRAENATMITHPLLTIILDGNFWWALFKALLFRGKRHPLPFTIFQCPKYSNWRRSMI